jgi:spore coat polysaccharide biosynthesis protein SpsF
METFISREMATEYKTITILTEGGKGIGLGHIRRCLVIAHALKKNGLNIFFCVNDDPSAIEWIRRGGMDYKVVSLTGADSLHAIANDNCPVLVDTKKPVSGLLRSAKTQGCKVILMDNRTDARFESDVAIYPSAVANNDLDWAGFKGTVIRGAEYIPIAKSFTEMRQKYDCRVLSSPYHVLITMGGSDPNRLTHRVLSSLLQSDITLCIKAVVGPAFSTDPLLNDIEKKQHPNVEFIRDRDDLAAYMAESHICITAVGTTVFELAYMGVPTLVLSNYRTDEADMLAFEKLGIALPIGYFGSVSDYEIRHAADSLLRDRTLWENMSRRGKILIDGHGAARIADIIQKL